MGRYFGTRLSAFVSTLANCNLSHWRLQRPWLSLWESCQPNRLTERVLRLMVGGVCWNAGPSQAAPYGAASSPKGRAKVASLLTMSNKIPFIGTRKGPTWREADNLPYISWASILSARVTPPLSAAPHIIVWYCGIRWRSCPPACGRSGRNGRCPRSQPVLQSARSSVWGLPAAPWPSGSEWH